ncbi:hypothetical protein BC936DRAFT_141354 [Jimgerdemannia flammicorona]|uniref:3-methyl-2-oxobutanoate hydroxymethyltransferase n=1 Tax=Jimgerdemannia flammicorona TaxID=994334 RepID=A0A433DG51_9FUNG|nr:hypothetical protein BC936DRAFT_141354 [Jimgerdemannia flammicorona]RUP49823.1 hypothetical protein BC936DRAFT_141354 [Jimgerdemannia flammicorona]
MFRSKIAQKATAASTMCRQCLKAAADAQTTAKISPFANQVRPFSQRRSTPAPTPITAPVRRYSSRPADKPTNSRSKVTVNTVRKLYKSGEPLAVMTAHDYPSGLAVDESNQDICLVGDSLAMVTLGYDSTNPITVDVSFPPLITLLRSFIHPPTYSPLPTSQDMLHHCRAVARGCKSAFLVGDLPYGSYETGPEDALRTALRFVKEGNVEGVKLEGGREMAATIRKITSVGIPVMGHVGLTPQRQAALGGYRVQGKTAAKVSVGEFISKEVKGGERVRE